MASHAVFCLLKVFEAPLARLWALHPFRLFVRVCLDIDLFIFARPLLVAFSYTASVVGFAENANCTPSCVTRGLQMGNTTRHARSRHM